MQTLRQGPAALLGISARLATYHVRRLHGMGLVRVQRERLRFLVFPTDGEERGALAEESDGT